MKKQSHPSRAPTNMPLLRLLSNLRAFFSPRANTHRGEVAQSPSQLPILSPRLQMLVGHRTWWMVLRCLCFGERRSTFIDVHVVRGLALMKSASTGRVNVGPQDSLERGALPPPCWWWIKNEVRSVLRRSNSIESNRRSHQFNRDPSMEAVHHLWTGRCVDACGHLSRGCLGRRRGCPCTAPGRRQHR